MRKIQFTKYFFFLIITTFCIFFIVNISELFLFQPKPLLLPGGPCLGEMPEDQGFFEDIKDTNTIYRIIISQYDGTYVCTSEGKHKIASNIILSLHLIVSLIAAYFLVPVLVSISPPVKRYLKKVIKVNT